MFFRSYVEQVVAPTLAPADIVILDNLSSHKVAGRAQGDRGPPTSLVCLRSYSPDLNPIEQAFAKLSALPTAQNRRPNHLGTMGCPPSHTRSFSRRRNAQLSRQRRIRS